MIVAPHCEVTEPGLLFCKDKGAFGPLFQLSALAQLPPFPQMFKSSEPFYKNKIEDLGVTLPNY
jgi:hypothetical protein